MRSRLCGLSFLLVASTLFAVLALNRLALLHRAQTELTAVGEEGARAACTAPRPPAPERLFPQVTICFQSPLR